MIRPGKAFERRERRGDLVGVVAEIVDDGDAICGADNVEATGEAGEALYALHRPRHRHPECRRGGNCGEGVGDIVAAGDDERRHWSPSPFAWSVKRLPNGKSVMSAGADVGLGGESEADCPGHSHWFDECDSLRIIGIPDAAFRALSQSHQITAAILRGFCGRG